MWSRASINLLLLFAIFPALLILPTGSGQVLSSFTTILTVTTQVVTTDTFYSTVGTTRGVSTVFHTAYSNQVTVDATGGTVACNYKALRFTASKGDAVSLDVKTSIPISIYIMSADDYRTWMSQKSCVALGSSLYNKQVSGRVLIDMIAPSNGDYDLVFLNASSSTPANVDVNFVSASQTVTSVSLPVVSAFPVTGTYTATSTVTTVQATAGQSLLEQYGLPIVAVILMLGVGFLLSKRRSRTKTKATTAAAPLEVRAPVSDKFCGDCGSPIPADAQFCGECGASTKD